MKKLLWLALVTVSLQCVVWNEKTTNSQKLDDMFMAVDKNDVTFLKEHMQEFLKSDVWWRHRHKEGRLFEKAVRENKLEIVKIFIEVGIGSGGINTYSEKTPLYSALENDNEDMIDLLLNNGANPFSRCYFSDFNEPSALNLAIEKNRLDLVKRFVATQQKRKGLIEEYKGLWYQLDILSTALEHEKEDVALFLIESDDQENLIDRVGNGKYTPVQEAFSFNLIKAAEALMNKGVDINYQGNARNATNLHIACEDNLEMGVAKLIEYGAHPSLKNKYGEKLPENLTENEEIQLMLKTARTLQECMPDLSKKSETIFSLITSFPLLSFTMYQVPSKEDFKLFYQCMNDDKGRIDTIAQLLNKNTFKNEEDFKNSLLDKAALRLKAQLYNRMVIEENEYKEKFGDDEFKKMVVTASRIKKFGEKN